MLTYRFSVAFDMRDFDDFGLDFDTLLGSPGSVVSRSASRVTIGTTTGATFSMTGQFDFSSRAAFDNSVVSGMSITAADGRHVFSVSGISARFGQLSDDVLSELIERNLIEQGISVYGSPLADVQVGGRSADVLRGQGGHDDLRGQGGDDQLVGAGGDDRLNGGAGIDRMLGGAGNDTYWVNVATDRVEETVGAGSDQVRSYVTLALPLQVEHLLLLGTAALAGTGNWMHNILTGNAGANTLTGLGGNDVLDGAGGRDRMVGGLGNDTYFVNMAGDRVVELAGQGRDTVWSDISYALPANVEYLQLRGAADLNGYGNATANVIAGTSGANLLDGRGGDDVLAGGPGADTLTGGDGADGILFDTVPEGLPDRITDFLSGTDRLLFDTNVFTALAAGVQTGATVVASGTPADGDDFLVYDQVQGLLYYDSSGTGANLRVVADLGAGTALAPGDVSAGSDILAGLLPAGGVVQTAPATAWNGGAAAAANSAVVMTSSSVNLFYSEPT